jgi:hypothetical protein
MNHLSSRQRKLVYLGGILLLLIPIIWLGMPGAGAGDRAGKLADLRTQYDLGENQLGKIDPTSAAMSFVLLGFRGIAADLIWVAANEAEDTKNWAELRANVDAIIMLEPHFARVWSHQAWNLAWNVSAAWDLVADRFYWVKEGAKFLKRGCVINQKVAQLPYDEGRILGQKIGRADEWVFYRKFFKDKDPNEELFKGRPDPEVNPKGQDNYLAAKDSYLIANEVERVHGETSMLPPIFLSYPWRSQLSYADALQREGNFDEVSQAAWEQGYQEWVNQYGQEKFDGPSGTYHLDMSDQDITDEANAQGSDPGDYRQWVIRIRSETRYPYWKIRSQVEAQKLMIDAHKAIYDGKTEFRNGNLTVAKDLLFKGMTEYEQLIKKYDVLQQDDESIEEGLTAVLYWQYILKLQFQERPKTFPLIDLWTKHQNRVPRLEERFKRENAQD